MDDKTIWWLSTTIAVVGFISGLFIVSCGGMERLATHFTGDLTYKCSRSGVEYVRSDSGLALHVGRNNMPIACQ